MTVLYHIAKATLGFSWFKVAFFVLRPWKKTGEFTIFCFDVGLLMVPKEPHDKREASQCMGGRFVPNIS